RGFDQHHAVVGDAPNLAARLQVLAEPGTIVISDATRRLLAEHFRLRSLGRHELKGLLEPVEPWAVEGLSLSESRFETATENALTPLVGRDQEIALLLERWALARQARGQVVLMS